jgi:EcsC protein family
MWMSDALAERDEAAGPPPRSLFERLRADPLRAPELVALAASERHAPAAAEWAERRRRVYGSDPAALGEMAKRRHASLARLEGAATGVGGFITFVPDLVGLAWIQSRMVFFIAAAYGYDPHDRMRPAELLVLTGLYPDPESARAALDGLGTSVAEAYIGSKASRDEALAKRLLKMVGKRTGRRVAGRLIPLFAVAFNAVANERDTRALADRAIAFYGG